MWTVALRIYLQVFGFLLLLGGFGHVIGIVHLYIAQGVPDANRHTHGGTHMGSAHTWGQLLTFDIMSRVKS